MIKLAKPLWRKILTGFLSLYCFVSLFAFSAKPSLDTQLLSALAWLVFMVMVVRLVWVSIRLWWRRNPFRLISPALVIVAGYLGGLAGHQYRDFEFKQDLLQYQQTVAWVRAQPLERKRQNLSLPDEYQELAYAVQVEPSQTCGLMVDFFWGAGFPVKHTIRRYMATPELLDQQECHSDWRTGRKLAEHWYELVD